MVPHFNRILNQSKFMELMQMLKVCYLCKLRFKNLKSEINRKWSRSTMKKMITVVHPEKRQNEKKKVVKTLFTK